MTCFQLLEMSKQLQIPLEMGALIVFSQTLIMEVSSSWPLPPEASIPAPAPGLCSFPRGREECLISACHRVLLPIESTLLGLAFFKQSIAWTLFWGEWTLSAAAAS